MLRRALFGLVVVVMVFVAAREAGSADAPASRPVEKVDITQPGAYRSGLWEYRMVVTSPGSKSEGTLGKLLFGGKPVPDAVLHDYYNTPWGDVQWVGNSELAWGEHGWVLRDKGVKGGRLLAEPWIQLGGPVVMVQVLTDAAETPKGQVVLPWVKEEMEKLGVKTFQVRRDWFPLNDQACTIEDNKMVGRLAVRLAPAREAGKLIVLLEGSEAGRLELPRKDGETKLLRRSLGVLNPETFYLAFRVDRAAQDWPSPLEIGAESDGKEVLVKSAKEIIISLPGDPGSGLVWMTRSVQGDSLKSSSVVASGEPQFTPAAGNGAARSGSIDNYFRVAGTGKTYVELEYKRPWQTDKPAEKTFKVTLDVKELAPATPAKP